MFCKRCGNEIDLSKPMCPRCGEPYKLEGGNGFWDLAGEPAPQRQPQHEIVVKEIKKSPRVPWILCAALCLLCLVLSISGRVSKENAVKKTAAGYEAKLSQQEELYENQIEELEKNISLLKQNSGRVILARQPIRVIASPKDEDMEEGFESKAGYYLFRFEIEGSAVSFQWEKQQDNGEWEPLEFDNQGIDRRYGLKLDEDCEEGISKLIAVHLTEESAGIYKCTVLTADNSESATVRLSIKKDESQIPTLYQPEGGAMKDEDNLSSYIDAESDEASSSYENGGKGYMGSSGRSSNE